MKTGLEGRPGLTFLILLGLLYGVEKVFSEELPEHSWLVAAGFVCALILLSMWALTQKARSYWWLFLVGPIPIAYFFLPNKTEA